MVFQGGVPHGESNLTQSLKWSKKEKGKKPKQSLPEMPSYVHHDSQSALTNNLLARFGLPLLLPLLLLLMMDHSCTITVPMTSVQRPWRTIVRQPDQRTGPRRRFKRVTIEAHFDLHSIPLQVPPVPVPPRAKGDDQKDILWFVRSLMCVFVWPVWWLHLRTTRTKGCGRKLSTQLHNWSNWIRSHTK